MLCSRGAPYARHQRPPIALVNPVEGKRWMEVTAPVVAGRYLKVL